MNNAILGTLSILLLSACTYTAQGHREDVANNDKDRLTVAAAQRDIKVGMSSSDVVEILGSPNMVTTDDQRRESWVYDKIATERVHSNSSGGLSILGLAGMPIGAAGVGGLGGGSFSSNAGASSTTQRTLTIVIKFDKNSRVRDYSYRSSSF